MERNKPASSQSVPKVNVLMFPSMGQQREEPQEPVPGTPDAILAAACSVAHSKEERRKLLLEECGGDTALASELEPMLAAWEEETPEAQLEEGRIISDRYRLQRLLGHGGTAVVWQAYNTHFEREVALKVFFEPELKRRWDEVLQEARAVAKVSSEHIVDVYNFSTKSEDLRYIELQLCRSSRADDRPVVPLNQVKPVSIREAVQWVANAARGLEKAHAKKVYHRDLKPANILVEPERAGLKPTEARHIYVTDFGFAVQRVASAKRDLAETTATVTIELPGELQVAGTPAYMAPEQAEGLPRNLDPEQPGAREQLARIDVFGLGATLYELLSGHPPYQTTKEGKEGREEVLRLARQGRPPPLTTSSTGAWRIPWELSVIVSKAMEKEPGRRYASPGKLAEQLEKWLDHEPTDSEMRHCLRRVKLWARRKPAKAVQLLNSGFILLQLGLILFFSARVESERRALAQVKEDNRQAIEALQADFEKEKSAVIEKGVAEMQGAVEVERKKGIDAVNEAREQAAADLKKARNKAAAELKEARDEAAAELKEARDEAAAELKKAEDEAAAELKKTRDRAAAELKKTKDEAAAELKAARDKAADELKTALNEAKDKAAADQKAAVDAAVREANEKAAAELKKARAQAADELKAAVNEAKDKAAADQKVAVEAAVREANEKAAAELKKAREQAVADQKAAVEAAVKAAGEKTAADQKQVSGAADEATVPDKLVEQQAQQGG